MTHAAGHHSTRTMSLLLAAGLAAAGALHLLLTPEHIAMSALFGAGFLAAAITQLGMAVLAVIAPSRLLFAAVIGVTLVLTSVYAYNVVIGLPFADHATSAADVHDHDAPHKHHDGGVEGIAADEHSELAAQLDHHEGGLPLGAGEPVDAYGALTQLAQVSAATLAVALLLRRKHP